MKSLTEHLPPRGWIPGAVTAANIAVGFAAILLAADGRYDRAVYLLVAAILLDMLDGRLARWLGATSLFGKQLDSFCDVLSFGAAPAFLIYQALLRPLGAWAMAVSLIYLLAGVYRLARFNLVSDEHSKARRTVGLPIPIGASYLMAATLIREDLNPQWAAVAVLIMATMMVSRWRLPDIKGTGLVTAMLIVGMFNYMAVVVWPNWYTVGWWNVWNLVILAAARSEDRRLAPEATTKG